ncbi:MAG: thioredoxin family protein [Verrucomicrobiota bacterium]
MKTLLKTITRSLTILALTSTMAMAAAGWGDDYDKALAEAKAEKKIVLLDFTGSDWCGWCIKLDKEVFSQPEFKSYAKANLVLVEVDFPQGKALSDKVKAQNDKLSKQFAVRGYPTIIALNSEGKQVGQLGYMPGGPAAFIAELEKLKGK